MIRRPFEFSDGTLGWAVISQVEHARVAGLLATYWNDLTAEQSSTRAEFLSAVYRHDDGWAGWEREADILPRNQWPRDFTEMQTKVSLAIWRSSIAIAERMGPYVAWLVSGHFSALMRRFGGNGSEEAANTFLDEQDAARERWLQQWLAEDRERHAAAIAERALSDLQFFDVFSLWLCCDGPNDRWEAEGPGGASYALQPSPPVRDEAAGLETIAIEVEPWPFFSMPIAVDVSCRLYRQREFASDDELRSAPTTPYEFRWVFQPARHD